MLVVTATVDTLEAGRSVLGLGGCITSVLTCAAAGTASVSTVEGVATAEGLVVVIGGVTAPDGKAATANIEAVSA